ncbi:MAG: glycyl-radical enzyme activating protein [Spirochaetes bacterium]|nr:glycyl-radical enzyme activating protein [Spirochaetota bacterium]
MVLKKITGRIYDIQGFSVHDGPGIRTTIFLKGCPLHCPWCHSPESQAFKKELCWMEIKCVGLEKCGLCLDKCPKDALSPGKKKISDVTKEEMQLVTINRSLCDDCGACTEVCYSKALYLCGTDYTVEEVMERLMKDAPFFEKSGGGVTVSGGEALSQPEFTIELLRECRNKGLHTALDTTGYVNYDVIKEVLPYTDLFLYDLKHMDSETHKKAAGVPNERIHENARKIAKDGGKLQVRIPVIPGFNDSKENIDAARKLCAELGDAVETVQVLPYHRLGSTKYQRLQREDPMPDCKRPSDEAIDVIVARLKSYGLNVNVH